MQKAECRVQKAEWRVQKAECRVQMAECRVQKVEGRVQISEGRVQSAHHCTALTVRVTNTVYNSFQYGKSCTVQQGSAVNCSHSVEFIAIIKKLPSKNIYIVTKYQRFHI